ncbi:hypothetical protein BFAG_04097 [Bacteroides fragilis 3_1_12]|uniref:Uncharacterized protein n=1 Tax=Bacteroides fragilis 3_1_12 TaxID=457424 RepID=A0ABN0BR86_BACFG|nr:hypothetical protein BFAG_04097 [Bacteroides fragilis 3_1_12]
MQIPPISIKNRRAITRMNSKHKKRKKIQLKYNHISTYQVN